MTRLSHDGPDLETLLADIADRYGPDVNIVDTKRTRNGGVLGFFAKTHYTLTVETPHPAAPGEGKGDTMPKFLGLSSKKPATPPQERHGDAAPSPSHSMLTRLIEAAEAKERFEEPTPTEHHTPIVHDDEPEEPQYATVRDSDEDDHQAVDPLFAHLLGDAMRREGLPVPTRPDIVDVSDNATYTSTPRADDTPPTVINHPEPQADQAVTPPETQPETVPQSHSDAQPQPMHDVVEEENDHYSEPVDETAAVTDATYEADYIFDDDTADELYNMAEYDEDGPTYDELDECDEAPQAEQHVETHFVEEETATQHQTPAELTTAHQAPTEPKIAEPAQVELTPPPAPEPPAPQRTLTPMEQAAARHAATPAGGKLRTHLQRRGMPERLLSNLPATAGVENLISLLSKLPTPPSMTGDIGTVAAIVSFGPLPTGLAEDVATELAGGDIPIASGSSCRDQASAKVAAKSIRRSASLGVLTVTHRGRPMDGAGTAAIVDAAKPEFIIAVVDARFKHLDTSTWLNSLAEAGLAIDALCVEGASATSEPATVLDLQPPIWRIDGARADSLSWLPLLLADYDT